MLTSRRFLFLGLQDLERSVGGERELVRPLVDGLAPRLRDDVTDLRLTLGRGERDPDLERGGERGRRESGERSRLAWRASDILAREAPLVGGDLDLSLRCLG